MALRHSEHGCCWCRATNIPFRELLVQVGGTDLGRQEANTRLIAAAPRLLSQQSALPQHSGQWASLRQSSARLVKASRRVRGVNA